MMTSKKNIFILALSLVFFFLAMAFVIQPANPLENYPGLDGGYYLYVGQQITHGQVPYRDVWESKPPGIFYLNAVGLWLGHGTRWGVWGLELLFLVAAAWLGFLIMRKQYGLLPALFGSLMWMWGFSHLSIGGGYIEDFSLLFSFIAILAFWKSKETPSRFWSFVVGLTFAANFWLRANNTGVQVAIVLVWCLLAILERNVRPWAARLLWSGLGVLAGLGLPALYLAALGVLQDAFNAGVVYNFYITGKHINAISSLFTGLALIQIPAGFMGLGYALLASQGFERRKFDAFELFLLIDVPLEIFLSGLSGRNYIHYFIPWLPALGFLCALLVSAVVPWLNRLAERYPVSFVSALLLLTLLFSTSQIGAYAQVIQRLAFQRNLGVELDHPVAAYVRAHSSPEDKILIWGSELGLAYMARRNEPTAYIFYPLYVPSPLTARMTATYYQDLLRNPPVYIVDSYPSNPDLLPALDVNIRRKQFQSTKIWPNLPENIYQVLDFITSHYHLETEIGGYRIYRYNPK